MCGGKEGRERGEVEFTHFSARIPTQRENLTWNPHRLWRGSPKSAHGLREYFNTKKLRDVVFYREECHTVVLREEVVFFIYAFCGFFLLLLLGFLFVMTFMSVLHGGLVVMYSYCIHTVFLFCFLVCFYRFFRGGGVGGFLLFLLLNLLTMGFYRKKGCSWNFFQYRNVFMKSS